MFFTRKRKEGTKSSSKLIIFFLGAMFCLDAAATSIREAPRLPRGGSSGRHKEIEYLKNKYSKHRQLFKKKSQVIKNKAKIFKDNCRRPITKNSKS